MFPERRTRILTEIVYKSLQDGGIQPNFELLLHPDHFKRATLATMQKIWGKFLIFGQTSAGVMGIYIIFVFIKLIFTQVSSVTQLYRASGFTWRLVTGCCPFMARHVLYELQREALTKYGQKLTDLVGNLSADDLKILMDKLKATEECEKTSDKTPLISASLMNDQHHKIQSATSICPDMTELRVEDERKTRTGVSYNYNYPTSKRGNKYYMFKSVGTTYIWENITINMLPLKALLDTGSSHTLIKELPPGTSINRLDQAKEGLTIDGRMIDITQTIMAQVAILGEIMMVEVHIIPTLSTQCIIGMDVIKVLQDKGVPWSRTRVLMTDTLAMAHTIVNLYSYIKKLQEEK